MPTRRTIRSELLAVLRDKEQVVEVMEQAVWAELSIARLPVVMVVVDVVVKVVVEVDFEVVALEVDFEVVDVAVVVEVMVVVLVEVEEELVVTGFPNS